jgi:hypothetical protein
MDESSPRGPLKLGASAYWWVLGGLSVLAVLLGVVWINASSKPSRDRSTSKAEDDLFPLPPVSQSPFLNTKLNVAYVGSEACRACHLDHDAAFRHTSMGRSMADVDATREPPDGAFDHPLSKRRYEVRRQDGEIWHRELLLTDETSEIVLSEFPVKYVVGSGHHSLTYLVETDGFLVESPITWYTSRKAWGMSPGYDIPDHAAFTRAIGEGCLICHASRAEALDGSLHRMRIREATIGCERCHGPGELHVARHRDRPTSDKKSAREMEIDHSIVNPEHLSRDLAEAICQQCHLRSAAIVPQRGRKLTDYRPGLPLHDVRLDYRLDEPDKPMTVVGHVEQLHLSRCYQNSKSLSCLTCHRPHDLEREANSTNHNTACLSCHQADNCRVDASQRQRVSPDNDCIQCHMPRSDTDIPHLTFTHHRIGVHSTSDKPASAEKPQQLRAGVLRPFFDVSQISSVDQLRALGLGYFEAANRESDGAKGDVYRNHALTFLTQAHEIGLRDPMLEASLGKLRFIMDVGDSQALAESALQDKEIAGQDRSDAWFLIADAHFGAGRYAEAATALHQLTSLRRHPMDWMMLADCERTLGHDAAHKAALLAAVRINPRLWKVHQRLAELFRAEGNIPQAEWHERRVVR